MTGGPGERPFVVLHVCTGNICRSPMAELLMRAELDRVYGPAADSVVLDGAGTYPGHIGEAINPPAGQVLAELGVDATAFRAQALSRSALEHADLVLCATSSHVRAVARLVPEAADRTFRLLDLAAVAIDHDDDASGPAELGDPATRLRGLATAAREAGARAAWDSAEGGAGDLEDPWGLPHEVYRATRDQILAAVRAVVGGRPGPDAH